MDKIQSSLSKLRQNFNNGTTLSYQFRLENLIKLKLALNTWEDALLKALYEDLGKSKEEAYLSELATVKIELKDMIKNLKRLMKQKRVHTPLMHFPSKSFIVKEPLGVVLIMSPWNYPLQLTLAPLIAAIAAGNAVIIKPSRYSENTSKTIKKMINSIYSDDYIDVFLGGYKINQELLNNKFDFIFFTGSVNVGRIVMEKASKHLTPVVLELGGKSPVYVDSSANIKVTASRLAWAKFLNVGQTCIAPDYVLCTEEVYQKLLIALKEEITEMYGENPLYNEEYGKIINQKHFNRLVKLLDNGNLSYGGYVDPDKNKIAPAILVGVDLESDLMQEEIFGPLLPIIKVKDFKEATTFIKNKPKPLAAYLFTSNSQQIDYFKTNLSFGGGCINDCIIHFANNNLPFGGVGESGMGSYHGEKSFETFSHFKSITKKSTLIEIKLRKPPLKGKMSKFKKLM